MPETTAITHGYTRLQRRLHWLVLLLVVLQYALQWAMKAALDTIESGGTLTFSQFLVTLLHTCGGAAIAVLMIWRWRLRRRTVPVGAGQLSGRRAMWVGWHHKLLYAVVLLMALSGGLHYFMGWEVAARWHELGKWFLLGLIGLHVAGALSHGPPGGNMVLQRMMGRGSLH